VIRFVAKLRPADDRRQSRHMSDRGSGNRAVGGAEGRPAGTAWPGGDGLGPGPAGRVGGAVGIDGTVLGVGAGGTGSAGSMRGTARAREGRGAVHAGGSGAVCAREGRGCGACAEAQQWPADGGFPGSGTGARIFDFHRFSWAKSLSFDTLFDMMLCKVL